MPQTFVRYRPDVERADPNFESTLHTLLESLERNVRRSVETDGTKRAVRDAHAKGYGLARGEVEIQGGLPEAYAQGIYATPGRHEALVRFSNGLGHTGPDAFLGTVTGIGLKLFDVEGPTLLEDEPNSRTFDYAMINNPVFFANTVEHYVFIHDLFAKIGYAPPANESAQEKRAQLHRFLYNWVTGKGTLPPEEWAWDELGAFLSFTQIKFVNLLLSTYWTMGAVRHGEYIAKLRVAPVQEYADRVERRTLEPRPTVDVFRPALVAELRERPYEFDVQVQLSTDLNLMPVEDVTVRWSETLSPFVTVAKLRLPRQDIGGDDNLGRMDATSMAAWRVTEEHRPLGNIMRTRKEVYRRSSILRHQLNHQVRKEPRNLAEVFGTLATAGQRIARTPETREEKTTMATQARATTGPAAVVEQKVRKLQELYTDAPEVGKVALEKALPDLRQELAYANGGGENAGRVGARRGKVSELTTILPLAKGGAKRLHGVLELLEGNFKGADKVGTLHDMRFVFLDNDTKLLFATTYDGDWDTYIDDFVTKIPDSLDLLFCNVEGWPGIHSPSVKQWLVDHQIAADSWYVASPNLTVADTHRLERVGEALDEFLDKVG